jgi:uncharacterized repeat protein (TIGR03803 family)
MRGIFNVIAMLIVAEVAGAQVPACNVTQDQNTSTADVQKLINEALGSGLPADDLNIDGIVSVSDVQIVIDAALKLGCSAPVSISLINPSGGAAGLSPTIAIRGVNTSFTQGVTVATFGAGISVGGATEGQPGQVTVITPTSAIAQLTIDPAAATGARSVTVTTLSQVATSANGFNVLAALPAYGPLSVANTSPAANATGVSLSATIQVVFNEPLDSSTITASTFALSNAAGPLPVSLSFNAGSNTTVSMAPGGLLTPQTVYTVTVAAQVKNAAENPLGTVLTFSFTTQPPASVTGALTLPAGLTPASLSVISYGGNATTPDQNGNFTATINPSGTSLVAAMIPGESFGLMAITIGGMPLESSSTNVNAGYAGRQVVRRTKWQVTASPAAAPSTTDMVVDFQTTAETLLFFTPALFASGQTRATNILTAIGANPATAQLAQILSQKYALQNPLSDPDVQSAGQSAVAAIVQDLIQQTQTNASQSKSSKAATAAATGTTATDAGVAVPAGVVVTSYCSGGAQFALPSSGLICLDLDYISFPYGSYAQNPDGSVAFQPNNCSGREAFCAVGWLGRVTPFSDHEDPRNISPPGPGSESPTGQFDQYSCSSGQACSFFWIDGNSLASYLDWQTDFARIASKVLSSTGITSNTSFTLPAPTNGTTNYVARFYSGGFADLTELGEVIGGKFSDQQSLVLGFLAENMNIVSSAIDLLSATHVFPDTVLGCVAEAMVDEAATAAATLPAYAPSLSSVESGLAQAASDLVAKLSPCDAQSLAGAATEVAGVASWFSGIGDVLDAVAAIGDIGEVLQRLVETLVVATPIETALIEVAPISSLPGNPVPSVSSLFPASAAAGSPSLSLTINGNGFLSSSTVSVNGTAFATTFLNSGQLQISLSTADLAAAANFQLIVSNTGLGGGQATTTFSVYQTAPTAGFTMSAGGLSATDGQTLGLNVTSGATASVAFDGTGRSSALNGASVAGYKWTVDGVAASSAGKFSQSLGAGSHTVALVVTDNRGGTSAPATGTVTVIVFNTVSTFSANYSGGLAVEGLDGNFYLTLFPQDPVGPLWGDIVKITANGSVTELHQFSGSDGSNPSAPLVQGSDGNFYGTTESGGANGDGTIFQMTPAGSLVTLHNFNLTDGVAPGALVQGADGNFYGTASYGGANGYGTIFKITSAGAFTLLYSFSNSDGSYPFAGLVQGTDGNFHGTTPSGGAHSLYGTVFKMTPAGSLTTLHSFGRGDGYYPWGLVLGADGNFYGTTFEGGAFGYENSGSGFGTVFEITPAGTLTTLHNFAGSEGSYPAAAPIAASDGNFYGVAVGCCSNDQTIFEFAGQNLTTVYSASSYADPLAQIIQATDGSFYGTTQNAGNGDGGTFFQLATGLSPFVNTLPPGGSIGAIVIIQGSGLAGATRVTFNGVAAAFNVVSDSEITATVPPGATTGRVQVTTPTSTLSSRVAFIIP